MPKQNGTYNFVARYTKSIIINCFAGTVCREIQQLGRALSNSELEDSTCSTLFELEVSDKVYPKGAYQNGKMNMGIKFGSFQA